MNIYDEWLIVREGLRSQLSADEKPENMIAKLLHALSQTEQNVLSEIDDVMLRQQCGILFGVCKKGLSLWKAPVTSETWVLKSGKSKNKNAFVTKLISLLVMMLVCGLCYTHRQWLTLIASAFAVALQCISLFFDLKKKSADAPKTKTQLHIEPSVLLAYADEQMKTLDRAANDMLCLNTQANGRTDSADEITLQCAADMIEAIYECNPTERKPAEECSARLLSSLGLIAVDYSDEMKHCFNILPSKMATQTISPAILKAINHQLLKRGTAAVLTHKEVG